MARFVLYRLRLRAAKIRRNMLIVMNHRGLAGSEPPVPLARAANGTLAVNSTMLIPRIFEETQLVIGGKMQWSTSKRRFLSIPFTILFHTAYLSESSSICGTQPE